MAEAEAPPQAPPQEATQEEQAEIVVQGAVGDAGSSGASSYVTIGIGLLFWGVILSLLVEPIRAFLYDVLWWIKIPAVVLSIIVPLLMVRWMQRSLNRAVLVTIFGTPLITFLFILIPLTEDRWQVPILRSVFLVMMCLIPISLYYLFLAARREGLLHELVDNLDRFGLIAPKNDWEIEKYLRKFEALYGSFGSTKQRQEVMRRVLQHDADLGAGFGVENVFDSKTAIPLIILTILLALGWVLVLRPFDSEAIRSILPSNIDWLTALSPVQTPVNFAFLGAYLFGLNDLFRRYLRKDLSPGAYVAVSIRLSGAIIAAWFIVQAAPLLDFTGSLTDGDENAVQRRLSILAFLVGFFPMMLWEYLSILAKKAGSTVATNLESEMPISDLDGLTLWHQVRLAEEDIENVPNMATADIPEVILNTRYSSGRVVDWVDQAILWTAIGLEQYGERRKALSLACIRTATALVELKSPGKPVIVEGIDTDALLTTVRINPNLQLIMNWRAGMKRG